MKAREFITLTYKATGTRFIAPVEYFGAMSQESGQTRIHLTDNTSDRIHVKETIDEIMAKLYPDDASAPECTDVAMYKGAWKYKGHPVQHACDHNGDDHHFYIAKTGQQVDLVLCAREANNG